MIGIGGIGGGDTKRRYPLAPDRIVLAKSVAPSRRGGEVIGTREGSEIRIERTIFLVDDKNVFDPRTKQRIER